MHSPTAEPADGTVPADRVNPEPPRAGPPEPPDHQPRGATAAQLRRFIKSRPYVPLHELRRRFELNGQADDVCSVRTQDGLVYVGLPPRECELLGELVRCGDIGLELCRDPLVPIVVGVFPMRPVVRA
ncbi:MAG: hypothetical protein ACHQZR_09815 [Candidatus Limnocylindrales bacterium]